MSNYKHKAVIYCRVSSKKQTSRGDGIASQETRCREFAGYQQLEVVKVFHDNMTGALFDRPGFAEMLKFVGSIKEPVMVVVDDASRLAREVVVYNRIRQEIADRGGVLVSPTIEFGEGSDANLMHNVIASVYQHQREKNAEQTVNRMRARLLNGYWGFRPPVGYKHERVPRHNKLLVHDEPVASIVREALEGFASGRFQTQVEVKRFLEAQPEFPKSTKSGGVTNQRVKDILTQSLYSGYYEYRPWGVDLRKGQHEPLISFETYQRIQERLAGKAKAPARKDINDDFPLRGFVLCTDCERPLTSCWSKGNGGRYAYYYCVSKGCPSKGKSVRKEVLEGDFEELLGRAQPSRKLFKLARAMFKDLWEQRLSRLETARETRRKELSRIEGQIDQLVDRTLTTDNKTIMAAYEKRITRLEAERIRCEEALAAPAKPAKAFEESFRTAMEFLANPRKLWGSRRIEDQRAVLKLTFADKLAYGRESGFRTTNFALPFKLLGDFSAGFEGVAPRAGFEPATCRLGGDRSIRLSYRGDAGQYNGRALGREPPATAKSASRGSRRRSRPIMPLGEADRDRRPPVKQGESR